MNERPVTVLLIEENTDDARLIEEALAEIEEVRYAYDWMPSFELIPAQSAKEALEYLETVAVDVVLLDLALPDSRPPHLFHRIQSRHPELPIVLLADKTEEKAALGFVRQGAQDYLLKSDVDCLPLGRCLRCGLERSRFRAALRSLQFVDDLTGLYTEGAFHRLAEKHWVLGEHFRTALQLFLVDVEHPDRNSRGTDCQDTESCLLRIAETLQETAIDTDIVARIGSHRFASLMLASGSDSESSRFESLRSRLSALEKEEGFPQMEFGWVSTAMDSVESPIQLLEAAERSLCENKLCAEGMDR